jgi:hypothetical protein
MVGKQIIKSPDFTVKVSKVFIIEAPVEVVDVEDKLLK